MSETKDMQKKEAEIQKGTERTRPARVFIPQVDILEKADSIQITADVPGVDEKTLDIDLEKNVLTLRGSAVPDIPQGYRLALSEYGIGDYERSFTLSSEIDRDRIAATIKNGVLRLVLPKAGAQTRKIPVKTE